MNWNWIKVKPNDRCTVCGKPDFCTYSPELRLAHCMRITSPRPSKNKLGGYFHPLDGATIAARPVRQPEPPRPTINAPAMMQRWRSTTTPSQYESLAVLLGVSVTALMSLQCAYAGEHRAWAFPMVSGDGRVVGIRLRAESGRKWAVTGGHEGVFLPEMKPDSTAYLPEGPTSLAAILTLGKFGIGRPNNSGGIAQMSATLARLRVSRAVILADNEDDKIRPDGNLWNPGLDGGKRLAEEIGVPCCILVLPCKDAREFVKMEGTSEMLDSLTRSIVWQQPTRSRNITQSTTTVLSVRT